MQIKLEGLHDILKYNINEKLSHIKNSNVNIDQHFRNKINDAVCSGLRSLGYYSPNIKFFLYPSSSYSPMKENYVLIVQVDPGKPIKVSKVNIILNGDISHDSDYTKLLIKSKSFVGGILNHSEYDNFKNKLLNISQSKGYFDAKLCKHELLVLPFSYQAFWNINVDLGPRYFFGATQFYGSQIKTQYLKNLSNIHPGMYYDNKLLIEFNRRLFDTNWFSSIVLSPNFVKTNHLKHIPLDVFLVPSMSSYFEVGIGYSSDTAARLKVIWKKPCFNIYGHSIENIISISLSEQFIDLSYKIPVMKSPLQEYYLLQCGMKHESVYNRQSSPVIAMNISRHWDFSAGWKRGMHLHCCFDCCNALKQSKCIKLIYPGLNVSRIRQRGDAMPSWGDSQRYSIDISNHLWQSHINFFFLQSQNVWIRTLFNKHRLIIRNNLGLMSSNDLQSLVPFARRFFFVNNYLIRGYKYQSLFFKSRLSNQLIIPSKLMIWSLEYQCSIFEKWWIVLFIDSGKVVKNIHDNFYFKFGTGVGIRCQSPVGPAKLDLAIPLLFNKEGKLKLLHVYLGLGPEL